MIKIIMACTAIIIATSGGVMADYYSPTLSADAQQRHEFRDVQQGSYPSGPAPSSLPVSQDQLGR
ncbi:hypothetical protein ACO2RV_20275 [Ancylobacter sp. VNQ12]|uniref:hypothetical protein n=1 Tax=Ancylobacter sp. VNQ12 TaxID=3400920 RepID=UPI003C00D13F